VTDFRNYICWSDDAVLSTTPRDAASLGDGHFQAIHHPLRLRRRRLEDRSAGRWVTEGEIVDALKGRLRPDGYLFIPIVGDSGTGKSHLVRWVKDQTQSLPNWESRYLPKNRTGIRQAIEIVIHGLTGPKIDEAREAIEAAPAHTETDEVLAERLLDELAILVSRTDHLPTNLVEPSDQRQQQLRKKLERQLPDLLRDPVIRRKLVAPSAVIHRLVGLTLRGRQEGDGLDDDATRFLASDLPLTFEEIGETSAGARALVGQLATIPALLDAAVDLINEALPLAEKRLSVSSQVDLVEVFRDVRRALLAEQKELALFIEDLTVLHGVEREFLDAIVEPARSDGGDMCNLRLIFAVTEGHFGGLDTVRTRCDDAYWLDAPYGQEGVDRDEALSFLGRYLNSSRLAPAGVEQSWEQRHSEDEDWLTNACKHCPHREICHDTFGVSKEGYGLYPLNAAAAGRFVEALSSDRFDPRDVVRELINRFLLQSGADMRQSAFPSDNVLTTFDRKTEPLPPLLAAEIRTNRPVDHERIINALRYWSDDHSPTSIKDATLTAFGLDSADLGLAELRQLEGTSASSPPPAQSTSRQERTDTPHTVEARLRPLWRSHFAELSQWVGRSRDLSAKATNDLRNLVHKIVLENLDHGPTPVHLGPEFSSKRFRAEPHIGIKGTVTQQDLESAIIVVDRTETNAAALQGLILASELDVFDFPQAANYRRLLADSVEAWTAEVVATLTGPPSAPVVSAVEGLIVSSTVVGHLTGDQSPADYINAIFQSRQDPINETCPRSSRWTALVAQAVALIPRLRAAIEAEFGESRGVRGEVRAVQADRLLPIVEAFTSNWRFDNADAAVAPLVRAVKPAVNDEWDLLCTRVNDASPHVDRGRSWQDQTDKVLAVLRTAHNAGRLRDNTAIDALTALAAAKPERAHRSFFEAAGLVTKERSLPQKLAVLAGIVPDDVAVVHAFVTRAAKAIEGVERDLQERQAASGGATDMETVVSQVLQATSRFADSIKGLAK
jgi:hypothetical protein